MNLPTPVSYTHLKDGEEYYSSLIHEMAHSTGHESRLNRLSPDGKFGGDEYAKEELVAELTAAMVGSALGFDSRIRDNNTAYLKSCLLYTSNSR